MDRNGNGGALPQKSRAELFDDEKRRIIDSCFNKREPDGSCASHLQTLDSIGVGWPFPPRFLPTDIPLPTVRRSKKC